MKRWAGGVGGGCCVLSHWTVVSEHGGHMCVIMFAPTPADCCHSHFRPIRMTLIRSNTLSPSSLHRSFSSHLRSVPPQQMSDLHFPPLSSSWEVEEGGRAMVSLSISHQLHSISQKRDELICLCIFVFWCSVFLPKEKELPGVLLGLRA